MAFLIGQHRDDETLEEGGAVTCSKGLQVRLKPPSCCSEDTALYMGHLPSEEWSKTHVQVHFAS